MKPQDCCCGKVSGNDGRNVACFKNDNQYPQDTESLFKCCTGETADFNCDPRYCDAEEAQSACKSIYTSYCRDPKNINTYRCLTTLKGSAPTLFADIASQYCTGPEMPMVKDSRKRCVATIVLKIRTNVKHY